MKTRAPRIRKLGDRLSTLLLASALTVAPAAFAQSTPDAPKPDADPKAAPTNPTAAQPATAATAADAAASAPAAKATPANPCAPKPKKKPRNPCE